MKRCTKLLLLLLFGLFFLTSCSGEGYEDSFKKIRKGDTESQVLKIMGKQEDDDIGPNNQYYIYYWFDGANSIKDAEDKTKKGIKVKYYCVILRTEDYKVYKILEKEDYFSGIWGED